MNFEVGVILGLSLGMISFLLWLLYDINIKNNKIDYRGKCPLCGHPLRKGERVKSDQIETAKVEIKTFIKGCPYCVSGTRKKICPICKKNLSREETILAISFFDNPKKMLIKGCRSCYPQGYQGYESKYK